MSVIRRRAIITAGIWAIALASATAAAAQAPERVVTLAPGGVAEWDGDVATGANVTYDEPSGTPCADGDLASAERCDQTLLRVDVPAGFWDANDGSLKLDIADVSAAGANDFDLYVYESDAGGQRGDLVRKSNANLAGPEGLEIADAEGYYLVYVVYWAVAASGYTARAELTAAPAEPPADEAGPWHDGRLSVDVPVPVVTIGLPPATVADLDDRLQPLTVDQNVTTDGGVLTLEDIEQADLPAASSGPNPMLPTARFRVTRAPEELEQGFRSLLDEALLEPGVYDANRIEDWLAAELAQRGLAPDANAPSLVVLHLAEFGIGAHQWKYVGQNGHLKQTRVFGERRPLLVLDPSARTDPFDADSGSGGYHRPVDAGDAAQMARMVSEATEFRMLQGPIWPVSTAPCHAVTSILAVSAANYAEATGLMQRVEDTFDPEMLARAFEGLTGGPTHFDVRVLRMPADDPALDALSRPGNAVTVPLRAHLEANWDRYHVDHEGCAEYLMVTFVGDAGTTWGDGVAGIAGFDGRRDRRIGLAWVPELSRLYEDYRSPLWAPLIGTPLCGSPEEDEGDDCYADFQYYDEYQLWNTLIAHETGHLFGQMHPHHARPAGGSTRTNWAFTTVWSTMSYSQINRIFDFGRIDRANWLRNRAGNAFAEAARAGRTGSPGWQAALEAVERLDWEGAWQVLAATGGAAPPAPSPSE